MAIEQFPTMQELFGSVDFCDCHDCRSVLSPAAYLVDLLHFLDPDTAAWNGFLSQWADTHDGKNYTDKYLKPYDALTTRRPDLPNLPLTCENTNTVLPYIDVVNEIFEYYVVHGALYANAAYDTGGAASADLIAEPQNILPQAYTVLNQAAYPIGLPFDLWIETARGFLGYVGTSLVEVLEALRGADPLELFTDAAHLPYYQANIEAESIGLSPAEYALLSATNPPTNWYALYGYADEASALAALSSASTLAARLGVTYQELVSLVGSGFVNPALSSLATLQKLGISAYDALRYEGQAGYPAMTADEKTAFEAALASVTSRYNPTHDPTQFDAKTWLDNTFKSGAFGRVLLLADSSAACDFGTTTLRYVDGQPVSPTIYLRLDHMVRLWRQLGWSLSDVDRALQTFLQPILPADGDANYAADYATAMKTALLGLADLQALDRALPASPGRSALTTIWSPISTTGADALYPRLFLNASTIAVDSVFDSPVGSYLTGGQKIQDHLLPLQGALGLTSVEVGAILADAGIDVTTAPLSLANVSLLYRYALLARALQLSIADFLELKGMSGRAPFAPLPSTPMASLTDDVPLTQTLAFVAQATQAQATGLTVDDLRWLLRHRFDADGKYAADDGALLQEIRTIVTDIGQIRTEQAIPSDPLAFTDEIIRQKLALAFPADVVERFMAMWTNAVHWSAQEANVLPGQKLDPDAVLQFPAVSVAYDAVKQQEQLTYTGMLFDGDKALIESAVPSPVLPPLLDDVESQEQAFFHEYLEVATIGTETVGFLSAADFTLIFTPLPSNPNDPTRPTLIAQKRATLASRFLPYLQTKLIRECVLRDLVVDHSADPALVAALVEDASLLIDPTDGASTLETAFAAVAQSGLSVSYYDSADGSGAASLTAIVGAATSSDAAAPKPASAHSAHFEGYLEVPADGSYRFYAQLDNQGATAQLQLDGITPHPLIVAQAGTDNFEASAVVTLKAGVPYHFTFDALALGSGGAALLVEGEALPKGGLDRLALYPEVLVTRYRRARVLLDKTLQLSATLRLSLREVAYWATHAADFGGPSFSSLPTQASDDSAAKAAALFTWLLRLQAYVELRQAAAGGTDGLIDVFERAAATFAATANAAQSGATVLEAACAAFADLTSRDLATVQAAAQQLGFGTRSQVDTSGLHVTAPDFASERGLGRLWQVLGLANRIGVSIDALAGVTGLVDTSKSEDDRATLATDFKNAVKAHYTVDAWRPIAQSIFDPLRQRKRDALSAWLVGNLGFTSTNQLFEYFLVDPGMEPVVQTSRIRLALSSVQTFVQRCLLNLESQVDPSAIPANQWEWMKRYRVWQANREIFLWPENWMEPEWRTDKTDLFQTLESALLQGDVTNELVEDALLAYLRELDVRARLQIVSMYMEEVPGDPAANKLHVLARTWGTPHKYYYRYRQFGLWSAWDPVKADIAGDHVAIIKWRERLHLFWVTFAQVARQGQTPADGSNPQPVGQMSFGTVSDKMDASAAQKQMQLQLGWSELVSGKWSAAKATDLSRTPAIDVNSNYEPRQTYIHAAIEYDEQGNEGAVKIILDSDIFAEFRLVNKNADPVLSNAWEAPETVPFSATEYDATQVRGSGSLIVWFAQQVTTKLGGGTSYDVTPTPILAQGNDWELVVCDTPVTPIAEQEDGDKYYGTPAEVKNLSMPFFYQDLEQHATLFVQPHVDETSSFIWWPGWVLEPPPIDLRLIGQDWWNQLNLSAQVPSVEPVNPPDPDAVFKLDRGSDWLANDVATISFGGVAIGKAGGVAAASAGADVRARLAMGSGS